MRSTTVSLALASFGGGNAPGGLKPGGWSLTIRCFVRVSAVCTLALDCATGFAVRHFACAR